MKTEENVARGLFERNYDALISYCLCKGLTQQEAEDAVSDAFYRFVKKYDQIKELSPKQQKQWMYSAVKINYYLKLKKRMIYSEDESEETINNLKDNRDDINNSIESQAYEQMIEQLRAELSEKDKVMLQILLERDSDISFKTLADKYGIHYPTLRTETKRFRKKVKKLFVKIFKE